MHCFRICRDLLLIACVGTSAAIMGCGRQPTGEVSGKITFVGHPPEIQGLQISFLAPNGRIVGAPIKEDGTYKATGVPVGEAKVGFLFVPSGVEPAGPRTKRFPGKGAAEAPKEAAPSPIPESLQDGSTSNLSVKVVAGQNQVFDFDMR
jgi:hypothetical protein